MIDMFELGYQAGGNVGMMLVGLVFFAGLYVTIGKPLQFADLVKIGMIEERRYKSGR